MPTTLLPLALTPSGQDGTFGRADLRLQQFAFYISVEESFRQAYAGVSEWKSLMAEKKKHQVGKAGSTKPSDEAAQLAIELPIEWVVGANVATRYANQLTVQLGQNECYMSFFEISPPLLVGSPIAVQQKASELTKVTADCVARIVLPKSVLPKMIQAIQQIWNAEESRSEAAETVDTSAKGGTK